jgi:predicted O-methyltransferase YrrM
MNREAQDGLMNDHAITRSPAVVHAIQTETEKLGFTMASEPRTGALLRVLAASKPGGRFLELGTGTGIGTAWLLAGMDANARLDTVDNDVHVLDVARSHLREDSRVAFHLADGADFLAHLPRGEYDLIYADVWPGKFTDLDQALALLRIGGIYFIDDLLPQSNWPEGHAPKVPALIDRLERRSDFVSVKLSWASGLIIVVRTHALCELSERQGSELSRDLVPTGQILGSSNGDRCEPSSRFRVRR